MVLVFYYSEAETRGIVPMTDSVDEALCIKGEVLKASVCILEVYKGRREADLVDLSSFEMWALTDSNRRPSACKADALNQLS